MCTLNKFHIQTLMSMGIFDFYFADGTSSVTAGLSVSPRGWVYAATYFHHLITCLALDEMGGEEGGTKGHPRRYGEGIHIAAEPIS